MTEAARVVVFCLPGIGDTLLFTPALRALKGAWPSCEITAVVMFRGAYELLAASPYVDEVLYFDFLRQPKSSSVSFIASLRRRQFSVSILAYPANRFEYNLMAFLVGARIRVGHTYHQSNLRCGNFLNNLRVQENDSLTNIRENLRLVQALTGAVSEDHHPEVSLPTTSVTFAESWLHSHHLLGKPLIGMHPGGSRFKNHIHKRWAPGRYIELVTQLRARKLGTVLVFGGSDEANLREQIVAEAGTGAVAVVTDSFMDTCALIARCSHFVSNDTALLHVAGALRVPSTAIFGPTNAEWVRVPDSGRREVFMGLPCQPCFRYSPRHLKCRFGDFRCLRDIPVGLVADTVTESMQSIVSQGERSRRHG